MSRRAAPIRGYSDHKSPAIASPSASIILISPSNQVLLLHRRQNSSAFPSAHVFPGGNLEAGDGEVSSDPKDPKRHIENIAYRIGAIRELFEESGILLARTSETDQSLLEVSTSDRKRGRDLVHSGKVPFGTWLKGQSPQAVLDTDGLIPFTHWVTPPNVPKRFSTQMYVYFVPFEEEGNASVHATSDEIETMAPEWRTARDWIKRAQSGEIILFPPQFILLHFISEHLDPDDETSSISRSESTARRQALRKFIEEDGSPPWKHKYISPIGLSFERSDKRSVLGLDKPGPELRDSELKGDDTRVVLTRFAKEGPREVEVRWRKEVMEEMRLAKEKGSKL